MRIALSLRSVLSSIAIMTFISTQSPAVEVNCYDGSSINGIEGFDMQVYCNPLAESIMVHWSFVEDFARRHLEDSGIDLVEELDPESGMIGIYLTSVDLEADGVAHGYATSINVTVNRAALCLLGDEQFHAISSIVWADDNLLVSDGTGSREQILEVLGNSLDSLASDLARADPARYETGARTEKDIADSGD